MAKRWCLWITCLRIPPGQSSSQSILHPEQEIQQNPDLVAGGNKEAGFLEEGLHFAMDTWLPFIFILLLESKTWVDFSVNCFS